MSSIAQWFVIHARMASPHTRVCKWRHITRKATFLACVIELGETGSYLELLQATALFEVT